VDQLIRLLTEAREISDGDPAQREYLISGIARIVGAAAGLAILASDSTSRYRGHEGEIRVMGWGDAAPPRVLPPLLRAFMRLTPGEPGAALTATWQELVTERSWCGPERAGVAPGSRPACLADVLFSSVRLRAPSRSHVHGVGLCRMRAGPPFSAEERNLVHVFHVACGRLLQAPPRGGDGEVPERAGARLSPRQRQALELVLSGLCDKEIAERLGISRYTVNQYTKAIYRHYAVTSRAQLLARVLGSPRAVDP